MASQRLGAREDRAIRKGNEVAKLYNDNKVDVITNTHGESVRVGEVYGFPISIASEKTVTDGIEAIQNRFVVEGEYKYRYNNGFIAMSDTRAACMNFVNALERLPEIIRQYEVSLQPTALKNH